MEEKTLQPVQPVTSVEKGLALLESMINHASVNTAFGKPVTYGETTLINIAEISLGMGFGFGMGGGRSQKLERATTGGDGTEGKNDHESGGGGGGGGAGARPVAVIKVKHDEVTVIPVIDATKIGLALLTMIGSVAVTWFRMHRSEG